MIDIGIVGDGHAARMTVLAASQLGLSARVLAPPRGAPTTSVGPEVVVASPEPSELERLTRDCRVVTFEHEQVDPDVVAALEVLGRTPRPGAAALRLATDKAAQREHFRSAGLPVPPFAVCTDADGLRDAGRRFGWPLVLKSPRGGFGGRGVWFVDGDEQAHVALAIAGGRVVAEPFLPLEAEASVIVARRPSGDAVVYPVALTERRAGVWSTVRLPSGLQPHLEVAASTLAADVAGCIAAVGVLAVELLLSEGRLLVDEVAAWPHDSGNATIEGCTTSQFENHVRAILDWPLGSTALRAPAVAMANVLAPDGTTPPADTVPAALALGDVHVHLYGQPAGTGPGIGHVTALGDDVDEVAARARAAADLLAAAPGTVLGADLVREPTPVDS